MSMSRKWFKRAQELMPGGVNSPVRAFGLVGGNPPYIVKGEGTFIIDADGMRYLDMIGSWGALLFGHSNPEIIEEVRKTAKDGQSFGACHYNEILLAEAIQRYMPGLEKIRLVNSGTEAAMSALRVARAATGRDKFIKFEGCYHGHADCFLVSPKTSDFIYGSISSSGVPASAIKDTLIANYNDLDSVEKLFANNLGAVAAIIVEPVTASMGVVLPEPGFLPGLRRLCDAHGALLIFDEAVTAFRVGKNGAAGLFEVNPDLTVLGKVLSGGMPLAAYGGRRELMNLLLPLGDVFQSGTYSGNPLSTATAIKSLEMIARDNPYPDLERMSALLEAGIRENFNNVGYDYVYTRCASMSSLLFGITKATTFGEASKSNLDMYCNYHKMMLASGIYLPPSPFHAMFLSTLFNEDALEFFLQVHRQVVAELGS